MRRRSKTENATQEAQEGGTYPLRRDKQDARIETTKQQYSPVSTIVYFRICIYYIFCTYMQIFLSLD